MKLILKALKNFLYKKMNISLKLLKKASIIKILILIIPRKDRGKIKTFVSAKYSFFGLICKEYFCYASGNKTYGKKVF